jgi:hypothetical protein
MGSLRGCTFRGLFGRARATALCGGGAAERAASAAGLRLLWSEALRNTMAGSATSTEKLAVACGG